MTILQILPELNTGGVETGTIDLAGILIKQGHKVIVVSNGGVLVSKLTQIGVTHYKLPVHSKSIFSVFKCAKALSDIIKQEQVQVVHARSRVPAIIAAIAVRRISSANLCGHVPVLITTCHGYYSKHIFSKPMGWGRFVIVSSNIIARHMIEDFKVPFERIKFIPRGVDLSKFNFTLPSDRKDNIHTIAVIGRITPIKGHQFFIRAAAKAIKIMPGVKIVIIGDTPAGKEKYKDELKALAKELGISDSIEFLGSRQDVPQLMHKIDLLVLPSTGPEAFGRVIIEAQASGVPVIATKVGGVTDIITDRKNGILVAPYNVIQLADAIIEILKNDELAEELAKNAIEDVRQKFTLDAMARKTISVYEEAVDTARILVIKIGAVGDVVLVGPSLRAIRDRFPKAHIAVLVGAESRQILQNCPYINELIIYNKTFIKENFHNFFNLAGKIRKLNFDIVIDFQNSFRSHLLSFCSAAPKRFGYKNKKFSFLLNYAIDGAKIDLPPVQHQFRVLSLLQIPLKDDKLELWPDDADREFVDGFLAGQWIVAGQPLVGVNIGGSLRWASKRLPKETMSALCDELADKCKVRVVLTGAKQYQESARDIISQSKSKPIDAVGRTTLNQLSVLISRCKVFVSTDSAPVHIAAAQGVPIVAIFGPTDPRRHMPSAAKNSIVIRKKLKCSPCYKPDCKNLSCVKEITFQEIAESVHKFL